MLIGVTGNGRVRSREAFTLIELLVVIAIIALLIAILLPSLEAARRQAKQNACLSHIKNIATSSRVYEADDASGWGIPVHPKQYTQCPGLPLDQVCNEPSFVGAYEWGGKSGIGQPDFFTGSADDVYGSKFGTQAGFGPSTRPMNDILYPGGFQNAYNGGRFDRLQALRDTQLELELFKCPGDNGPPRGGHCRDWIENSERSSYDHFGNSYAANVFMVMQRGGAIEGCQGCETSEMASNSPYMRPTSRVPTPARTLYFEENIGRWAWSAKREQDYCVSELSLPGVDPGPGKSLGGWHGKDWTYNRAFVDAHAETQKIYIEGTEDKDGFALHYRSEQIFDDPGRNRGSSCIIVRGDGWQKDTLPAELIRTRLIGPTAGRPSYEGEWCGLE